MMESVKVRKIQNEALLLANATANQMSKDHGKFSTIIPNDQASTNFVYIVIFWNTVSRVSQVSYFRQNRIRISQI